MHRPKQEQDQGDGLAKYSFARPSATAETTTTAGFLNDDEDDHCY